MSLVVESVSHRNWEPWVFTADELDDLEAFFRVYGFGVLRGLWTEEQMAELTTQCIAAQDGVIGGTLDDRHGNTVLVDDENSEIPFANYVQYLTEVAPVSRDMILDPMVVDVMERWLGPERWLLEHQRFGVVYQDARPGKESAYTRIGWHSDWQSAPHRDMWPSVAFTIHIDGTSPANGFLRVVPGSHLWATPAPYRNANGVPVPDGSAPWGGYTDEPPPFEMPLGFEKVPGEIATYCERGDVLFHDAYLWHSAARASAEGTMRRHVRGGFYATDEASSTSEDDFVKNAAR